jgi:hypothetical protein
VLNHVAQPARIECDYGRLAQQRFDRDQAQPFFRGWNDKGRSALVKARQL